MFAMLEHRDVAGVEMDVDMFAAEAVDKSVHFHRRHQIAVKENIFDIKRYIQLFRLRRQFPDRFASAAITNIIRNRFVVVSPWYMNRAGDQQYVFHLHIRSRFSDHARQFDTAIAFFGVVAGQRIWPKQERTEAADFDTDFVSHFADGNEIFRT